MPRPNIAALRNLHQSLPAAQKLFAMLAGQAELAQWISVDDLIENLELGRRSAVDLLREIANSGAGEFRLGRKGHPSRLVWSTDPRALVDRVLGRELEPADDAADPRESDPFDAGVHDEIEHVFMLRPQLRIALSLPVDLSGREAAAIGDWVRNLSFDR